jgi:hypothetical protein
MHDSASTTVQIDLNGIPGGIAKESGLVSLVGGSIVEPRLGKREHGSDVARGSGQLKEQHGGDNAHTLGSSSNPWNYCLDLMGEEYDVPCRLAKARTLLELK